VIIDVNNNIWIPGNSVDGQLGLGSDKFKYRERYAAIQIPNLKPKYISSVGIHTVIIDLDDNVWTFGANEYGD
jgi:alpha-tubulin suppressor-like RCC1 family protein